MQNFSSNTNYYFQLFTEGNERGFNHFYKLLFHDVRRFAYKTLSNKFEADTITQDAFLGLWNHRDKINDANHLVPFAKQIIKWSCSSYFKRQPKNLRTILLSDFDSVGNIDLHNEQTEIDKIKDEQIQLIKCAIPYLPSDKRTFLKLFNRGLTPKMIANITKTPYQRISIELKKTFNELKRISNNIKKSAAASRKRSHISVSCFAIYLLPLEALLIKLYYEDQYEFSEIAKILNISKLQAMLQFLNIKKKLASLDKNKILK